MTKEAPHKIVVLGSSGQVGRALMEILGPDRAIGLSHAEASLEETDKLPGILHRLTPSAVINAAAYTQVDHAETQRELAFKINAEAPGVIAQWCAQQNIPFVHYSTDYVFDGSGDQPRSEDAPIAPLNVYGQSKAEGERRIVEAKGRFLCLRTSWAYDAHGKNFVNTMLRLGAERETLKVVADQIGAPTYAPHLAQGTLQALENALAKPNFPSGIYHLCQSGQTSWFGFAEAIFESARKQGIALKVSQILPISTAEYPVPAKRPLNSRLSMKKIQQALEIQMPDWRDGLDACMLLKSRF
ncbi:dTDP-4-dehydrorhamnose reductase [Bdellovibrionota bacterium FG-1]